MPARFIPPFIGEKASNAERKIFDVLSTCKLDCIILHSVGLADHTTKVYGEIDFVIICRYGVLCLEVKGGAIEYEKGIWKYYNRYGDLNENTEGPFKQATTGMFSLRNFVHKHPKSNFRIANALFSCGVAFPDTSFTRKGVNFIPEVVLDQRNISEDVGGYFKRVFNYWDAKCKEKTGHSPQQLTDADISLLSSMLRSDFKMIPSYKGILEQIDSQILKYTDEQITLFEAISNNDRIVVTGSAGTGKTVIGLEYAKRCAKRGERVLFLTYNRMLAEYLRHKSNDANLNITHFHGFLSRYIEVIEGQGSSEYYEGTLPNQFLDYCSTNEIEKYDIVIIDEGQDLLRFNYLLCIDAILSNTLERGKWCILLDPNQNIYNSEFDSCFEMINSYQHTNFELSINCRNTKQIGSVNLALHDNFQHPKYMRVNGENVVLSPYGNIGELTKQLKKTIKDLVKKGVDLNEVIILLPYRFENSSLSGENIFKSICSFKRATELDFISPLPNTLRYSTVHSYKGLEAKIIILLDFDFMTDKHKLLSYIAMSRAKTLLYVFYDSKSADKLKEYLEGANVLDNVQLDA